MMQKQTLLRLSMTVLCVLCAVWIFSNSLQTGEESSAQSAAVLELLARVGLRPPVWVVRKLAHLTEYALYGGLLFFTLRLYRPRLFQGCMAAFCIGAATGGADEALQRLVSGRSGQLTDAVIDSTGVLLGILLALALYSLWRRHTASRAAESDPCAFSQKAKQANADLRRHTKRKEEF